MDANVINGKVIQYRKVGTFRVLRRHNDLGGKPNEGWYECQAIKAPKKYREGGNVSPGVWSFWVGPGNVVAE